MSTMHDSPRRGEVTSCCGRDRNDLPLGEGMSSRQQDITCDGTYEPALLAHEVYPHPSDDPEEPPSLQDAARYHAARALAMYNDDVNHPGYMERLHIALAERTIAWHVAALHFGRFTGQDALDWIHGYDSAEDNELLYDLCVRLGVKLDRIKPYPLRAPEPDRGGSDLSPTKEATR